MPHVTYKLTLSATELGSSLRKVLKKYQDSKCGQFMSEQSRHRDHRLTALFEGLDEHQLSPEAMALGLYEMLKCDNENSSLREAMITFLRQICDCNSALFTTSFAKYRNHVEEQENQLVKIMNAFKHNLSSGEKSELVACQQKALVKGLSLYATDLVQRDEAEGQKLKTVADKLSNLMEKPAVTGRQMLNFIHTHRVQHAQADSHMKPGEKILAFLCTLISKLFALDIKNLSHNPNIHHWFYQNQAGEELGRLESLKPLAPQ